MLFYIKWSTWSVAGKAKYFTITVNTECIFCAYNFIDHSLNFMIKKLIF